MKFKESLILKLEILTKTDIFVKFSRFFSCLVQIKAKQYIIESDNIISMIE